MVVLRLSHFRMVWLNDKEKTRNKDSLCIQIFITYLVGIQSEFIKGPCLTSFFFFNTQSYHSILNIDGAR